MNKKPNTSEVIAIPERVLTKWLERHSRGDSFRIHEITNLSRPTITRALRHGFGTINTILEISKYYSGKKVLYEKDIESEALRILST